MNAYFKVVYDILVKYRVDEEHVIDGVFVEARFVRLRTYHVHLLDLIRGAHHGSHLTAPVDRLLQHAKPGVKATMIPLTCLEVVKSFHHQPMTRRLLPMTEEKQNIRRLLARGEMLRHDRMSDTRDALGLRQRIVRAGFAVEQRTKRLEHLVLESDIIIRLAFL